MAVSSNFLDYVLDLLAEWGDIYVKRMFGGAGLYREGLMFALVANDVVYLKVDETNRDKYIREGSSQLKPFKNQATVLSFYNIPPDVFEDADEFIKWAEESLNIQKKKIVVKQ